jgi:hypothetical protein
LSNFSVLSPAAVVTPVRNCVANGANDTPVTSRRPAVTSNV